MSFLFSVKIYFSVDELRRLLSDKDAYHQFLLAIDQVKIQNKVSCRFCSSLFHGSFLANNLNILLSYVCSMCAKDSVCSLLISERVIVWP